LDVQNSLIVDELKRDSTIGARLLVEKYQDWLYIWGKKQYESLSPQDLLEIIDDTFIHVIEKTASFQFRTEKGFKNWVFTIFSRLCIDRLRKEGKIADYMQIQSLDSEPTENNKKKFKSARLELDRKIFHDYFSPKSHENPLAQKVRDFLDGLDEDNRTILLGCAMEIPHRETGKWTGIPVKHIKTYYSRLKKKLKNYLKEAEGG
jgi:RNA polymerase sigma factor (sigma-70 family)